MKWSISKLNEGVEADRFETKILSSTFTPPVIPQWPGSAVTYFNNHPSDGSERIHGLLKLRVIITTLSEQLGRSCCRCHVECGD